MRLFTELMVAACNLRRGTDSIRRELVRPLPTSMRQWPWPLLETQLPRTVRWVVAARRNRCLVMATFVFRYWSQQEGETQTIQSPLRLVIALRHDRLQCSQRQGSLHAWFEGAPDEHSWFDPSRPAHKPPGGKDDPYRPLAILYWDRQKGLHLHRPLTIVANHEIRP